MKKIKLLPLALLLLLASCSKDPGNTQVTTNPYNEQDWSWDDTTKAAQSPIAPSANIPE